MRRSVIGYGLALASAAAAVGVRLLLDPWLGDLVPFVTLIAAIFFVALFAGRGPALLTLVAGAAGIVFFVVRPRYSFAIASPQYRVGLVLYALVGYGAILLIAAQRRAMRRGQARERQLAQEVEARRAAEAVLAERERLIRVTLASIGDAVITTDAWGIVASLNAVAEQLTGWTRAEAAGQPLSTVFRIADEETRQLAVNPVEQVLREGCTVGLANYTLLIDKEGTERIVDASAALIRDDDGEVVGSVWVFRDVTEKRAKEAVNKQALATLQSLTDGFWLVDRDWHLVYLNAAAAESVGQAMPDLRGRNVWEIFPAAVGTVLETAVRRTAAERVTVEFEDLYVPLARWFAIKVSPAPDGGLAILSRDITARKRAESEMAELSQRLSKLVDNTPLGVVEWDAKFRITRWSGQTERLLGWTAAEAIGKRIEELRLVPDEDRPQVDAVTARLRDPSNPFVVATNRNRTKAGKIIDCEWYNSALHDDAGGLVAVLSLLLDVTDRERALEALREDHRRKDEFLATLAHELRNPLAPIWYSLELMRRGRGNPELMEQARSTLERQTGQLVRLVDDLLDVSRITRDKLELRREPVELAMIVQHAVDAWLPTCRNAHQEFSSSLPPEPIMLQADAVRLTQVLGNLLTNAHKFTPPGGRIALTVQRLDDEVTIAVEDNGVGIPPEMLPKIFDLFTQVDRSMERTAGGLGIGLSLVKRLVQMHDGTVTASSDGPGRGSRFVVRLPVLPATTQVPV